MIKQLSKPSLINTSYAILLLQVVLKDSSPVELVHHSCTCVAGAALCNHCVALLFQSAHYSQLKVPVVPPMLSCTEGEQQWHKPRTLVSDNKRYIYLLHTHYIRVGDIF